MGAGVLGAKVAESLQAWGVALGWGGRSRKCGPGGESYVGREELGAWLRQTRVMIVLLPDTAQTVGIIN
ncbi:glyoxylate/hydroxypyruvate reductase GhrA, partial [Salmonella enterica]